MPKFAKGHNSGNIWWNFFKILSDNLIIISNQWTEFQSHSLNIFRGILLRSLKCQNFQRAITPEKIDRIHSKINQIIYSSSSIKCPSFKPLAQILFEISCWQDLILIFSKGHNSKGKQLKKKKNGSAIFLWGIHIWNFETLACTVHKTWHASDFIPIFSKRHNSRKGDNSDKKKKNVYQLYFHIWNFKTLACTVRRIWHASKSVPNGCMHAHMDNPKPICPLNFFELSSNIHLTCCTVELTVEVMHFFFHFFFIKSHGMKGDPPGYLPSKYECFLMSGINIVFFAMPVWEHLELSIFAFGRSVLCSK